MKVSVSVLVSAFALSIGSPAGIGLGGSIGGHGGGLVGGHGGGIGLGGGHVVHSGPVHGGDYNEQPDPFKFEYGVHDDKYYTDFSEHRSGDEYGNIVGEYQVALPDGRIQYVKYTADGNYGGTIMEVSYKGEARHPDIVHHSSGHGHGGHGGGIGGGIGGGHGIVG
eukprot:TRINITY_DN18_c0_g1_i8.p1 TRINITY_DN18_c0_g1~~TRINITY_DN18_c0_g1_i8.p1  ORF type:complete len:186 (-),score=79.83 TRINITY_DN18_c0_g1_i8:78-575(-)